MPPQGQDNWYWSQEWSVSRPTALLAQVTRLCSEFSKATSPYSPQQIDQGVWFLLGACIDLPSMLCDPDVPWRDRKACIASMPAVYSTYVAAFPADVPLETCFDMWFDLLGDAVTAMRGGSEKNRVTEAAFQTLVQILAIEDARCQHAALHGLGHLPHPKRGATVERWLRQHRGQLSPFDAKWVKQCRDGTVM
jgi:hypothetical protein